MKKKEKVILGVFKCVCTVCSEQFDFYEFSDFIYGERLIRTKNGKDFVLVKCYEDPFFKEVGEISDEFFKNKTVTETIKSEYFDKIFGLAFDPINGNELDASVGAVCPNCNSQKINRYEYDPRKKIEMYVNLASYNEWGKKTQKEKRCLIHSALRELFKE